MAFSFWIVWDVAVCVQPRAVARPMAAAQAVTAAARAQRHLGPEDEELTAESSCADKQSFLSLAARTRRGDSGGWTNVILQLPTLDEGQQVGVHHVGVCRAHS